jgi:hypothetical protein
MSPVKILAKLRAQEQFLTLMILPAKIQIPAVAAEKVAAQLNHLTLTKAQQGAYKALWLELVER